MSGPAGVAGRRLRAAAVRAADAGGTGRALLVEVKRRTGRLGPLVIVPYRGHATDGHVFLRARVLEQAGLASALHGSHWAHLRATWLRFASSEVPRARVRLSVGDLCSDHTADREGFVTVRLPAADLPAGWSPVQLSLLWPPCPAAAVQATGEVLRPPPDADVGVVSDLDDTVIASGITRAVTAARVLLFTGARTRLPFPGVAEFYRGLARGPNGEGDRPVFYLSTSPWNLYDLLADFLDLQGLPKGPVFLTDWGPTPDSLLGQDTVAFKGDRVERLLADYPRLRLVLIGDSGQHDPEVYAEVARRHPDRLAAVYIRETDPGRSDRAAAVDALAVELAELAVPMLRCRDTLAAAEHAHRIGLVDAVTVARVRAEQG